MEVTFSTLSRLSESPFLQPKLFDDVPELKDNALQVSVSLFKSEHHSLIEFLSRISSLKKRRNECLRQ